MLGLFHFAMKAFLPFAPPTALILWCVGWTKSPKGQAHTAKPHILRHRDSIAPGRVSCHVAHPHTCGAVDLETFGTRWQLLDSMGKHVDTRRQRIQGKSSFVTTVMPNDKGAGYNCVHVVCMTRNQPSHQYEDAPSRRPSPSLSST